MMYFIVAELVGTITPVGNGAYIVTVPRPSTRLCPTSRCLRRQPWAHDADRCPHDIVTDCVDWWAHVQLPQRSLTNKVDDMLELRRYCHIDIMYLAETWHDTDSVAFRRLGRLTVVNLRARVFLRLMCFNGGGTISCTICDLKCLNLY